ncbi:UNVERIFIED_CONTAM: hypothetical protein HDU68_007935, partial [Siphonaria sp. JEL0065]
MTSKRSREVDTQSRPPKKPNLSTATATTTAKAPAKVILFGEHSVVYPGKRALACALDVSTTVKVKSTPEATTFQITLPEVGIVDPLVLDLAIFKDLDWQSGQKSIAMAQDSLLIASLDALLPQDIPKLAKRAVLSLLVLYLGISNGTPSISISASSEIPTGSGLGSSASFCVSLAASLLLHNDKIKPLKEGVGNDADLDLVNEWALCGETVLHGLVSGVDNTVVCFGGANIYVKGQPLKPIKGFPALRMLLTNTKIEKDTKKQVAIVTSRMQTLKPVTEKLVDAVDAIVGECCTVLKEHEEESIPLAAVSTKISTLIEMNQGILASLGVSHPSLESIVNITRKHGLSSKLTGAGGGGCALTLIPDDFDAAVLKNVRKELEAEGFECFESLVG